MITLKIVLLAALMIALAIAGMAVKLFFKKKKTVQLKSCCSSGEGCSCSR